MPDRESLVRVAALGDLHCNKNSRGTIRPLFENADRFADILVLCGDLTDYGLPEEARLLVDELAIVAKLPIVAVLGNHDFESGQEGEVSRILVDSGIKLLDGDAVEIRGVGFAGAGDLPAASAAARWARGVRKQSRRSSRRRLTNQSS